MPKYDIHIHLPEDESVDGEQFQEETQQPMSPWLEQLLGKINQCYDWKSFYELAEDFQQIGLAIQETQGGRLVLCKLSGGRPVIESIIDDYIFVGGKSRLDEEISQRGLEVILNFVQSNAGKPQRLIVASQDYTRDMSLYGKPLRLYNEAHLEEQQQICLMGRIINE